MVLEAFLPGVDGGERSAVSTRVILQAKEVKEKASKIKKDFGADFFSQNEPDSDSNLAMAFKQVVMEQLTNFRLDVFSPGSERDFQDLSKSRKVYICKVWDNSEVLAYCMCVVNKVKDSCGCPGVVDENIGAWVGELPDYFKFKGINLEDNAASDDIEHSSTVSQENQTPLVSTPTKMTSHLEQNDNTQETRQNIASRKYRIMLLHECA